MVYKPFVYVAVQRIFGILDLITVISRLQKDSLFLSENPHMPYCGGYSYIQTRKQYHGEVNYLSEVIHAGPVAV